MSDEVVQYSQRLQTAVDNALALDNLRVKQPSRNRGKNSLSDMVVAGGGGDYNGMFKVVYQNDAFVLMNGNDTESEVAGYIGINGTKYSVAKSSFSYTGTATAYIYVIPVADGFSAFLSNEIMGYSSYTPNLLCAEAKIQNDSPFISQIYMGGSTDVADVYGGDFSVRCYYAISGTSATLKYTVSGGQSYANAYGFSVEGIAEQTLSSTVYINYSVQYDDSGDGQFSDAKITADSSRGSSESTKPSKLLATLTKTSDNAASVAMNHCGEVQVFVWGACEHGE